MSSATPDNMGLKDLNQTVSSLWDYAVSERTFVTYKTGLRVFKTFLLMNNLVHNTDTLPELPEDIFLLFIAHCYKTLKLRHTTIKLYLCGIRFAYLRLGVPCPLIRGDTDTSSLRIITLLKAVKRLQGQINQPRHPITATILNKMCSVLQTGYMSPYTDCLLQAACVMAFFGFLRCGEFTVNQQAFDPTRHLCLGDLTFHDTHTEVLLKMSKTDPFRNGTVIPLFKQCVGTILCPYTSLKNYIGKRNNKFPRRVAPAEPLFLTDSGEPLSRIHFISHVHCILTGIGVDTTHYSEHSFRIGAASTACSARLEDHLIRTMGRWTSDCYRTYIRTPRNVIKDAQTALLTELHLK